MKLLCLLLLVLLTSTLWGQGGNAVIIRFPGAPTGSCSPIALGINNATGDLYDCLSAAWHAVGGGGGTITGSGTAGKVPVFTGATAIGNGSLSDDAAGTVTLTGSFTALPDTAITGTEVDSDKFCISASCWYRGTGSPQTAVTASTGSFYSQTDSGSGSAALWVKDNGVGNTGWEHLSLVSGVTGTANQIDIANGTTAPVASLSSTITLPGTINKYTLTAPATGATLAIADGKTFTSSNSLTLAGTDSTTQTFQSLSSKVVGVLQVNVGNTDSVSCPSNTVGNFATTYTIPSSYLVANKVLRITLGLNLIATATVPTMAFRLTIGGTSVYAPAGATLTAATAGVPVLVTILIQGSAAAGGSAAVYTNVSGDMGSTSSVVGLFSGIGSSQPVNLATNGSLIVQPQLFCSTNTAGNSMTLQQMIVEALN